MGRDNSQEGAASHELALSLYKGSNMTEHRHKGEVT